MATSLDGSGAQELRRVFPAAYPLPPKARPRPILRPRVAPVDDNVRLGPLL